MATEWFVGLMSGTSLDGVDGVLLQIETPIPPKALGPLKVLAHVHRSFPAPLRAEFLALNQPAGSDELHRACLAGNRLASLYADVVSELLSVAHLQPAQICAIGAHGQTVRHCPQGHGDKFGYTVQVNNPSLLAELSGIDVVADFRSRDLAAGGQGAPLVPAFHQALFADPRQSIAILNLGGISNITILAPDRPTQGFDCGPANVLMDAWCFRHCKQPFDTDGQWAAGGTSDPVLLSRLLCEPYFSLPPPKSTGRDRFNLVWLDAQLAQHGVSLNAQDVQATLCELTAQTCAQAIKTMAPDLTQVFACGGGALNTHLMQRLKTALPDIKVDSTDALGLPVMQVEATAFAWLASAHLHREAGNLAQVTGAQGARVLGALYPK